MQGFEPGENLTVLKMRVDHDEPILPRIGVHVPARLHLSVLDMNRFAIGRFGGGGIGMSANITIKIAVKRSTEQTIRSNAERAGVVCHIAEAFRKSIGYEGGFEISATSAGYKHVGLGSTSSTLIGTVYALNQMFGAPVTLKRLRELVAYNFVEEDD